MATPCHTLWQGKGKARKKAVSEVMRLELKSRKEVIIKRYGQALRKMRDFLLLWSSIDSQWGRTNSPF
jgi:hypothetical protein